MSFLDDPINKRINSGNLPLDELIPLKRDNDEFDIISLSKKGLDFFQQNKELFSFIFLQIIKETIKYQKINIPFDNETVKCLINANCTIDYLNTQNSIQEATSTIPYVTFLDKVIWNAACIYCFLKENEYIKSADMTISYNDLVYTWIYLFQLIQKNELSNKCTIRIESVKLSTPILDIIIIGYNDKKYKRYFKKLSDNDYKKLKNVCEQRTEFQKRIKIEDREGKNIAKRTEIEWVSFLQMINYYSKCESETIDGIISTNSKKEKIKIIEKYKKCFTDIDNDTNKLLLMYKIGSAIDERFTKALSYNCVKLDEQQVELSPVIFSFLYDQKTFNRLFISFHYFRLLPNIDTAMMFVSLALECIKKNLGEKYISKSSLTDIIEDFYTTVSDFVEKNEQLILSLEFDKLQPDAFVTNSLFMETDAFIDFNKKDTEQKIQDYLESGVYFKNINNTIFGGVKTRSKDEIFDEIRSTYETIEKYEKKAKARQIIVSLNAIYLFCDALRIMLNEMQQPIISTNRETIQGYRNKLLNIDDRLTHIVYKNLNKNEINMREYREKAGIISENITGRETQEEKFRNLVFSDILKNSIYELVDGIETQNIDQIIQTNKKIRAEILKCPDCDEKDDYADWLDTISTRICTALKKQCISAEEEYNNKKSDVLTLMGKATNNMPPSALDSLTTAELLYEKYVNEKYAQLDFDFSCVSIIYYMALEDYLNSQLYTCYAEKVLNPQKRVVKDNYEKYISDNRIFYDKKKKCYKKSIELGTLGCLFENINDETEYQAFLKSNYETICFDNLKKYGEKLNEIAPRRNEAAHGGNIITFQDVQIDRKSVYSPALYRGLLFEIIHILS